MLWANENGLMYVLDRTTGQFLMGKPFVEVYWMNGFDEKGRPVRVAGAKQGGTTNWAPPSYSPSTAQFYVPSSELATEPRFLGGNGRYYGAVRAFDPKTGEKKWEFKSKDGGIFNGVLTTASNLLFSGVDGGCHSRFDASKVIGCLLGRGSQGPPDPTLLADGDFYALDARTGQLLWQRPVGGAVQSGPMSYSVEGKQYIAVAAGNTLFAFALKQ